MRLANSIALAAAGASGSFQISSMSGLTLHIDPALSSDTTTDAASVSTLTNLAGVGNNFTQSGSNRPVYDEDGIAGLPAIHYTAASSQYMAGTDAWSVYATTSAQLMMAVVQLTSVSTDSATIAANDPILANSNGRCGIYFRSTGPSACSMNYDGAAFNNVQVTTPALGTPFLVTAYHSGSVLSVQVNNGTPNTDGTDGTIDTLSGLIHIGYRTGAFPYFNGRHAEIVICNEYNAAEVASAQQALNDKYNLW